MPCAARKRGQDFDQRAAFNVDGLQPGHYEAQLWCDVQQSAPVEFDIPEGGDEKLMFVFVRAEDDG